MTQPNLIKIGVFLCLILCAFGVMAQASVWHYSYYDIGIYGEALFRLRDWSDLNPFIPGRGIRIFNDHFDPILILVAPLANLIPAPMLGILLDFLCVTLAWFPIRLLKRHRLLDDSTAAFVFAAWVLNHAIQNAVSWPFHPTTWGNLPLFYLFTYFLLEKPWLTFWSFAVLCLTREEFPLLGIPLSLVLYLQAMKSKTTKRPAFAAAALTAGFLGFQYLLKPRLIDGPHSEYGKILIQSFLSNPSARLSDMVSVSFLRMSLERYWPLGLLAWVAKPNLRSAAGKLSLFVLMIGASILGIRYASYQWAFHYGPAALIVLLFALMPHLKEAPLNSSRAQNSLKWATLILILFSIGHSTRLLRTARQKGGERSESLHSAWQQIEALPVKKILASNHLAANVRWVSKKPVDLYILGGLDTPNSGPYELVWVEKPPGGDAWRIGHARIAELIQQWRSQSKLRILRDDAYSFIAYGVIENDR